MRWIKGRQGTGYEKLKIFQFLNMDCYILRYNTGDYIPWHTDPVPNRKHYRLNIELVRALIGGRLFIGRENPAAGRIVFFRSDLEEHMVTTILKGKRIVLTFGIAIKENPCINFYW